MSVCLEAFESEMRESPQIVDRFFKDGKFDVSALLAGAEELGYELEQEDLLALDEEIHQKPLTANIALLVPDAKTGELVELTVNEVELVAAGTSIYTATNVNVQININVNVVVVAAAIALVIVAVGVFVFV